MMRLRIPSIRYETGFAVANHLNQSVDIRLRGRLIEEMKRKTKKTGKIPFTASVDPVRSAANAPKAANPSEITAASPIITTPPAIPDSSRTPKTSPIER
jgi:hypothetical protein